MKSMNQSLIFFSSSKFMKPRLEYTILIDVKGVQSTTSHQWSHINVIVCLLQALYYTIFAAP